MAVRKRGNRWQIDYFDPAGKRIRKGGFKLRREAEVELAKITALIAEGRYLDVKKESTVTLRELIEKYTEQYGHQNSFQTVKRFCIRDFQEYFGTDSRLTDIKYYNLESFRNHRRNKPNNHGKLVTDATVNRWMSCLRHMFKKAVEWDLIEKSPFDRGKSLLLKENNKRMRFLSEEEISRLLAECPEYLQNIVICALNSGMRRSEILSLKWDQIRNGFIYLRKTKTNESRQIPINKDLDALFEKIRITNHFKSRYVFIYQGEPVKDVKVGFHAACKRAGITDFHFHDLRHTFASHLVMKGASLKDVQELLGHTTLTMTLRYAHLSQEHKKNAINLITGLTDCHKSVTLGKNRSHQTQKVSISTRKS